MAAVRLAVQSDMAAVARLESELFTDAWSEDMLTDCLGQAHYTLSVCVDEADVVLGYLISTHIVGEAELLRIGVAPAWRRQGLGVLLMDQFMRLCEEKETPAAFLEVRDSNVSAISLYERFGFETVGKRKNYYHHPEEDARLMSLQ